MMYSDCDGSFVPEWLAAHHDYMKWASQTNPLPPVQPQRPAPPQQRAIEVEPPLSGATAQALIEQRAIPPTTRKA